MIVNELVANATAVAQFDIAGNTWWQIHDRPRVMRRVGLLGGTAAGQFFVDIYYGTRRVGSISNSGAGSGAATSTTPVDTDMKWTLGKGIISDLRACDQAEGFEAWRDFRREKILPPCEVCPVGTPVHVIVRTQPTTNALNIVIDFAEL